MPRVNIWRKRASIAAIVAALWAAPLASQQAALTVGQVRQIAVAAVSAGDAGVAVQTTDALLQRSPNSAATLILATEAALLAEDYAGMIRYGQRAYWNARTGGQRYAAARLVAFAHANLGQDTRGQTWLRLARQDAPNDEARASVARDFRSLRARNPLALNFRFGIAPSTNVNNGAAVEEGEGITLFGLDGFVLSGDARALSGWEVSSSANLTYRVQESDTAVTFLEAGFSGRTYVLTEGAQAQAGEDVSGSDFADANLSFGVRHRFILEDGMQPTSASLSFGQNWYGGEPNARLWTASASQSWRMTQSETFILSGLAQNQVSLTGRDPVKSYRLQATVASDLGDLGNVGVSLAYRWSQSDNLDADYNSIRFGVNYAFPEPIFGIQFGVNYGYEERDFAGSSFGPRDIDIISTASLRAVFTELEFLGFQPVMNIEHSVQSSDLDLFDREYTNFGFDITSSF